MDELKTSTRFLLTSAGILLFVLTTAPLGYRLNLIPLMPSLISLFIAFSGGVLVVAAAMVMLIKAFRQRLLKDRNKLLIAVGVGLIPVVVILPWIIALQSPILNDITTDKLNPPAFEALLSERAAASDTLQSGSLPRTVEDLDAAYPDVQPLNSDLDVVRAVSRAETVLRKQGMEIVVVTIDPEKGLVEATATTKWFRFKDDVVVRATPQGSGSRIDVRSASRIGLTDFGANAERIERFQQAFLKD